MQTWHWILIGTYVLVHVISVRWVMGKFMKTGWRMDAGPIAALVMSLFPFPFNALLYLGLHDLAGPNPFEPRADAQPEKQD